MPKGLKVDLKFWINTVTIVALVGLAIFSRQQVADALRKLTDLDAAALLFIPIFQFCNYFSISQLYRNFFVSQGEQMTTRRMLPIALELNFVNMVFPSGGVSGFSYLSLRLKRYGISTAKSTLAQIVRFGMTFTSFLILLFLGMLILAFRRHTSPLTILISSSIAFMTLFLVIISIYIISDEDRIKSFTGFLPRVLNRVLGLFRKNKSTINVARIERTMTELHKDYKLLSADPKSLKKPFFWALAANASELMTIYVVYVAFGSLINPGALIIAYAVANFAGLIAILPGGVGIYEGLMTAVLSSAGVPRALALSATVVYRVLNMLLILPIGYFFYHRALASGKTLPPEKKGRIFEDARD